jgi:hypothetical protein
MVSWWDSVDSVQRFNNWMQGGIVLFGVIAALTGVASWLATNRIDELQEIKTLALERRVARAEVMASPRKLSTEQEVAIQAALTGVPSGEVDVVVPIGDVECQRFANAIRSPLRAAGWQPSEVSYVSGDMHVGEIVVLVTSDAEYPPHAIPLIQGLQAGGLNAAGGAIPEIPPGVVQMWVGPRTGR